MTPELFRQSTAEGVVQPPVDKSGPRQCCSDVAYVVACDGEVDVWTCPLCDRTWEAPCR